MVGQCNIYAIKMAMVVLIQIMLTIAKYLNILRQEYSTIKTKQENLTDDPKLEAALTVLRSKYSEDPAQSNICLHRVQNYLDS